MYKSGEEFTLEQVREKLGLTPEWDDTLKMMGEVIKKLEPLGEDSEKTYDKMVQIMKERMNPDARLKNERDVYDSDDGGDSWWHTTDEGRGRLGQIEQEVRTQLETQA